MALLLVLTVTTLNFGAQEGLPRVSYVKAIDVWFLGCHKYFTPTHFAFHCSLIFCDTAVWSCHWCSKMSLL